MRCPPRQQSESGASLSIGKTGATPLASSRKKPLGPNQTAEQEQAESDRERKGGKAVSSVTVRIELAQLQRQASV